MVAMAGGVPPPIILETRHMLYHFAYNWGVASLERYLDELLSRGRGYFSAEEGLKALGQSRGAFAAAAKRMIKKEKLSNPRRGFYLIVRPEDRVIGVPDPARWIDPLMKYLGVDYRVSLLRAAAFHGASHQAAMVFQVVAPRQLHPLQLGRQRIQFVYQAPAAFVRTNREEWLGQIKSESGYAKVAGIELTLLDAARYDHNVGGINGAAQIVHDLGDKASPQKLARAAAAYENSAVRRLGYLLDSFGHERQANALVPFAKKAKSVKQLDPSVKSLVEIPDGPLERNAKWKLIINEAVEIDS